MRIFSCSSIVIQGFFFYIRIYFTDFPFCCFRTDRVVLSAESTKKSKSVPTATFIKLFDPP